MAKRRASTPIRYSSDSDNITVAPQRRVRRKLAHNAPPLRSSSSRELECVLIPARERLVTISANIQQAPQSHALHDVTLIYERPLAIDGKRSRKPNVQRTTISDFFRPRQDFAEQIIQNGNKKTNEIKSKHDERKADLQQSEAPKTAILSSRPTQEHSEPEGSRSENTNMDAYHNKRPRRSIARQSYATEMADDFSEDEIAVSALTLRRKSQPISVESDFEEEESLEEEEDDEDVHSEQEYESETEKEGSESEEFMSDEGHGRRAKSRLVNKTSSKGTKVSTASAARGVSSKTGKQTGKATAQDMQKLFNDRKRGEGLKVDLPPLSSIDAIYTDITAKAISFGLKEALETNPRILRVATMCSGTESPLLALEMVQDILKRTLGAPNLNVEHLFSAEIVPYKQAYIERNFHPRIIFRDITEITLAVDEEVPTATTAYGSKVAIPGDVDILIAGTSCVDFSRLNNYRKALDQEDGGESSKTWFGVLSYVKAFRPAIVILENVSTGPFDHMMECYREIDYEVGGVLLDTKDFYLPQTRRRGYLVCFDKSKANSAGIEGAGKKWQSLMSKFQRYASSSVAEFMLPTEKLRATQQLSVDEATKEYNWANCEIRHILYRQQERLGSARPWTFWSESGTMNVPENGDLPWYRKQVERVRDFLDISLLRKASLFDVRYKTRIWDVSQNVDMNTDTTQFGITSCITPSGSFFVSDAGRALSAEENLILQGLPLSKISLTTETSAEVQDLGGNAMSTTVVGPAILSALICGQSVLQKQSKQVQALDQDSHISELASRKIADAPTEPVFNDKPTHNLGFDDLVDQALGSARRCLCEASVGISRRPIQRCIDCDHTTCTKCGGNPLHNYQLTTPAEKRSDPAAFERNLRSRLPACLEFDNAPEIDVSNDNGYHRACKSALTSTYNLSRFQRTHEWTVIYQAPSARLECKLNGTHSLWRLFALPDPALPANSSLRAALQQPVAEAACDGSLVNTKQWQLREPTREKFQVRVEGFGQRIASWLARLGLTDHRDQQIWSFLRVETPPDTTASLGYDLNGTYQALPLCGTASDSLYKKVDVPDGGKQIYLLQNPTRTGDPKLDAFVFTTEKERLDFGVERPIIANLDPKWTPWAAESAFQKVALTPVGAWKSMSTQLREKDPSAVVHTPKSLSSMQLTLDCRQAELMMECNFVNPRDVEDAGPFDIVPTDEKFVAQHSHILEVMRRQLPTGQWRELPSSLGHIGCACESCAPLKPAVRWMLNFAGLLKPYEDPISAGKYERTIKHRPDPMPLQLSHGSDHVSTIKFGVNLASLAHRAVARLPSCRANRVAWMLEQDIASVSSHFQTFTLRSTEGHATPEDIGMTCRLFPKQSLVLDWMQHQEAGKSFMIEEAEEASLPALGWRAEVRAEAEVIVRGGICADHPGFGKTITSLALIHTHLSSGSDIIADLRSRQTEATLSGLIPTKATLIVAPHTLVDQWIAEIKEKLGYTQGVLKIDSWRALDKHTTNEFEHAKIIVLNCKILDTEDYAKRLANFAAMPEPATNSGRAFSQWLAHACKVVPAHLRILRSDGLKGLSSHVKSRYAELIASEDFQAVVPSRRLVGKDYAESKSKPNKTKAAAKEIRTEKLDRPLLEQFFFNRIIVDEFHDYSPRQSAILKELKADKRWGLSGTPDLTDVYDIAQIADLLKIPLRVGSYSTRTMASKTLQTLRKDMTDFERFDAMRESPSDRMHARIREVAQGFLDAFVRQNVMDFGDMAYEDQLIPVKLDADHQAAYAELSQQLASSEMNIRKVKQSKTTMRDKRFMAAIDDMDTAEKALSMDAAFYDRGDGHQGLQNLIDARQSEVDAALRDLEAACFAAQHEVEEENLPLVQVANILLEKDGGLGDSETINHVKSIIKSTANPTASAPKNGKSQSKKKSTVAEDDDGNKKTAKESKETTKAKELAVPVNALAKSLLTSIRSKRYINSVRSIQETASRASKCDSAGCSCDGVNDQPVAVSALCGHRVCNACYKAAKEQHKTQCAAQGCNAAQQDHHLLWSNVLQKSDQTTPYGAKLDAAVRLLEEIRARGEKAILFVQHDDQVDHAAAALNKADMAATIIEPQIAGEQIADFCTKENEDTVLVLNATSGMAAGSNIQAANHVIFLSPLLRANQYLYDSIMAQAIGRVRRHGQRRPIQVYRIFALHTIDVDILEHREHRNNALVEPGAPAVQPPPEAMDFDQHDSAQKDRVQLVKEKGRFSLRPRSWLYLCDANDDEQDLAKVKGRNRVAGWEDFSSQVKFSRAFAGDE